VKNNIPTNAWQNSENSNGMAGIACGYCRALSL